MLARKWGKTDNNSPRKIDNTSDDEIVLFDNTKCKTLPDSWLGYCFNPTDNTDSGEEVQTNFSFAGFLMMWISFRLAQEICRISTF